MRTTPRRLLLSTALIAALAASAPVLAQDADAELVAQASVPEARLVERYTDLAGSEAAAGDLVSDLRTGADFTVVEEVTTTTTNPDGTTTDTTELVERTVVNPNGPMGWGEVNISLSLAQALVDSGAYPSLQSALTGIETTVTNPDGTTTITSEGGVLAMRAEGMGWGAISKELGFNLGSLVSASNRRDKSVAASARVGKAERTTGKPDRIARVDRPEKPEKLDRPQRPERPERPQKPERSGRP
ncbi:MAG TPA: hypothetical protein VFX93_05930 [Xanthomonadaceae bacterium]|nr:hypothetical protein [Xanthomonadaceae bacterium]